jgi:N-acetylmuramoyl-L-alanine amidase
MTERVLTGTMSTFGGPSDTGVSPSEGLALCEPSEVDLFPETMFLEQQPPGTTGLARRLNPEARYCAARWDYDVTPRSWLQNNVVIVTNPDTGKSCSARPIDWGPSAETTDRICDLSPGVATYLGLATDDVCTMVVPLPPKFEVVAHNRIAISSGHGLHVAGASGPEPWGLVEVQESRNVVEAIAVELRRRQVEVMTFHDNESHTQDENLKRITDWHNEQDRDIDVSIHFNAYEPTTTTPRGTECWYTSQSTLANQVASATARVGLINRGAKHSNSLYFLTHTAMPAVLHEVAFVDSKPDCELYRDGFDEICRNIAAVLSGPLQRAKPKAKKPPRKHK